MYHFIYIKNTKFSNIFYLNESKIYLLTGEDHGNEIMINHTTYLILFDLASPPPPPSPPKPHFLHVFV